MALESISNQRLSRWERRSGFLKAVTKGETIFLWGEWGQWEELARRLFEGLRWLEQRVTVIVAPLPPPLGLGLALRDRLQKAASPLPAGEALVGDALQSH